MLTTQKLYEHGWSNLIFTTASLLNVLQQVISLSVFIASCVSKSFAAYIIGYRAPICFTMELKSTTHLPVPICHSSVWNVGSVTSGCCKVWNSVIGEGQKSRFNNKPGEVTLQEKKVITTNQFSFSPSFWTK